MKNLICSKKVIGETMVGESMRKDIEQIKNILVAVKKINCILNNSEHKNADLISDILITVEELNTYVFGSKVLTDYNVCELLKNCKNIDKNYIVSEISRWHNMVEQKIEEMKTKDNWIDYEFYSLMNYIEMVPEEIILEDMKKNFQKIRQYGDEVYHCTIACYQQYNYWGEINPYKDIWNLLYDRLSQLKNHREEFIWLYEELADYRSKMVLNGILHYWIEYDHNIIKRIKENNYKSYFDLDIVKANPDEVFVDLGAYTGDTIEDYLCDMGTYKQIYCYEISKDVFEILQRNLSEYENISFINKGVGERNGIMYMSAQEDVSANRIVEQGEEAVEIVSLDEDIREKITFIKMDIEGAEQQALKGAERHIREEKPKLAVCTYHNNHDIWQIPRMIREMNPDYKLYMRYNGNRLEYEFNVTEFVTFAI